MVDQARSAKKDKAADRAVDRAVDNAFALNSKADPKGTTHPKIESLNGSKDPKLTSKIKKPMGESFAKQKRAK